MNWIRVCEHTFAMIVPGGTLYRYGDHAVGVVSMVFVPMQSFVASPPLNPQYWGPLTPSTCETSR